MAKQRACQRGPACRGAARNPRESRQPRGHGGSGGRGRPAPARARRCTLHARRGATRAHRARRGAGPGAACPLL